MTDSQPTFTIGIEADYLLVHRETRDLGCRQVEVATRLAPIAHPRPAARPQVPL